MVVIGAGAFTGVRLGVWLRLPGLRSDPGFYLYIKHVFKLEEYGLYEVVVAFRHIGGAFF